MGRLKDKVMIITGGGSGIGESAAKLSAKEGATVVVTGRTEATIEKVANDIKEAGGEALAYRQDVTDEEQWKDLIKTVLDKYGKIDVLVNNAGMSSPKNITQLSTEEWDFIQKIDLDGPIYGMRHVIPVMQEQGGGSIINMSSLAGLTGMAGTSPYTAAKGALMSLSMAAAVDFGKDNIRVNTIHPGIIVTPMTEATMEPAKEYYETHTQLPTMGEPDDIGYAVVYLASDEAKFITGNRIVVDGGWTAI